MVREGEAPALVAKAAAINPFFIEWPFTRRSPVDPWCNATLARKHRRPILLCATIRAPKGYVETDLRADYRRLERHQSCLKYGRLEQLRLGPR